ncbi:hypothetical protein G9A89_021600 [Geosiphon pyriformis]|nr:hypothetical protein G9A89_021600 [Geosiphon pyriformis]
MSLLRLSCPIPRPIFRFFSSTAVSQVTKPSIFARKRQSQKARQTPRNIPLSQIDPDAGDGYFKITLRRSVIGLPGRLRLIVEALGLRRINHTVYREQRPNIAGMILKIKEIVELENVDVIPPKDLPTPRGYTITSRRNIDNLNILKKKPKKYEPKNLEQNIHSKAN